MLLAAVAALTGAAVQSATGFGFALVLGPALFAVLEPSEAVTGLLLLGLPLNLLVLAEGERLRAVRWGALLPVLVAAVPGLAIGAVVLSLASKEAMQVAVGGGVLGAAAWRLRRRAPRRPAPPGGSTAGGAAAGLASGVLTTSLSVSGPPVVLWLESRGLGARELRASLAAAFGVLNLAGAAALVAVGGFAATAEPAVLLPLFALVAAGYVAGAIAFRRLPQERFSTVVLTLVAAAGAASLAAGLTGG